MIDKKYKIFWNNTLVGLLQLRGSEMSTLYGFWHPERSDVAEVFVELLKSQDVEIMLEGDTNLVEGRVTSLDDDWINIRLLVT